MRFGIYPGGPVGGDGEIIGSVPDDPAATGSALAELHGGAPFHVRAYAQYTDRRGRDDLSTQAPRDPRRHLGGGTCLDLVLQYQSVSGDVPGFCVFVERMIAEYGPVLGAVQIGEEPNVTGNAVLDGAFPRVLDAVGAGIVAAKNATRGHCPDVPVGTNTTQLLGDPAFYRRLLASAPADVADHLDYIGLDAFPDVFVPLPPDADPVAVCSWLLSTHRTDALVPAGLGHLPIHITEHGWPTGPARAGERQRTMVEAMVTAALQPDLHVASYTHFSLRDAAADGSLFAGFGLLRADYAPKPAYLAYRRIVREHATRR